MDIELYAETVRTLAKIQEAQIHCLTLWKDEPENSRRRHFKRATSLIGEAIEEINEVLKEGYKLEY